MKTMFLLSAAIFGCGTSLAQDVGHVISSSAIVQQVGVPRTVCTTEQVSIQPPKSGAGALMGAIAGGAMGNAMGGGNGKAAATMIGIMGGAIAGDSIEGTPLARTQNSQRCSVQTIYENRPVAYNVVYDYAGKQYSVQMPNDPGPTVLLRVTPVGAFPPVDEPSNTVNYPQTGNSQPVTVFMTPPVYRVYEQPVYSPPVRLYFGFGNVGGYGGHRHWR